MSPYKLNKLADNGNSLFFFKLYNTLDRSKKFGRRIESDKIFTADWFSKKAWTDYIFNLLIRLQDDFLSSFFPHVTLFTYIFVATIKWLFTLSFVLRPLSSLATIKLPRAIEGTTRSTISTDSLESRFKGKMKNSRRSRFDIRPWKYRNLKLDNRQARIKSREYAERKVIWFRREGNIYWTMKNKTDRSRLLDPQMIKIADTVSLDDDNNNISWPYKYSYRRFQNQRFSRTRELR